jgi:hypothetical protein
MKSLLKNGSRENAPRTHHFWEVVLSLQPLLDHRHIFLHRFFVFVQRFVRLFAHPVSLLEQILRHIVSTLH